MPKFIIKTIFFIVLLLKTTLVFAEDQCANNQTFNIGTGIYDITGPAAEEGMMGYGMVKQQTAGIYQRLWARAFIIESQCNQKRVVIVNTDLGQVFQGIKQQVVKKLQTKFGNLYSDNNVLITATHTHSGPGGYSTYAFYNLTTLGFSRDNFNVIVDGIVAAIERAQNAMTAGQLKIAKGELTGISYNRSPTAYLKNPQEERSRYTSNFDTRMTLVRFDSLAGKPLGMINWFPLHGVSMNNKNHLINGDNKGYAEYLFEKDLNTDKQANPFIAAFAQEHAGDVSPNQLGHEGGSGLAGIQAVEAAGGAQYQKAKELWNTASEIVSGGVDYRHTFVEMDQLVVDPKYTNGVHQPTCRAAIGISMLAGTQDGAGYGQQGVTCDTISKIIPRFVCESSTTYCQGVKPIVLSTGTMKPYPWTPNILPFQIVKIGKLVIVAVPFEITTMSGRRIKETIAQEFKDHDIVLATLSNAYSGYVATNEEYELQRYEAASTHFGPWTLGAIRQITAVLAKALNNNLDVASGPQPNDLSKFQINFQPGVVLDTPPLMKHFGDISSDVNKVYAAGDTVEAVFWGAHPKNNYRTQDTFLTIDQYKNAKWETIRTDNDWDTEYHWQRSGISSSLITVRWRIPKDIQPGIYRIVHFGDSRNLLGGISPYAGYSSIFTITG